jgi:hypothetical protein
MIPERREKRVEPRMKKTHARPQSRERDPKSQKPVGAKNTSEINQSRKKNTIYFLLYAETSYFNNDMETEGVSWRGSWWRQVDDGVGGG